MCILSFDLGKFKSVASLYLPASGDKPAEHSFRTIPTTPAAGWIKDLCETLGLPIAIADTPARRGSGRTSKARQTRTTR